jgi:predicted methyltransferase
MSLYYADERVTLWHGDCREVLPTFGDRSVDCVITDPPLRFTPEQIEFMRLSPDERIQWVHHRKGYP